jgi:hypothetical protein
VIQSVLVLEHPVLALVLDFWSCAQQCYELQLCSFRCMEGFSQVLDTLGRLVVFGISVSQLNTSHLALCLIVSFSVWN